MNTDQAREVASYWYEGQWSGLYQVACSHTHEKLSEGDWREAVNEAARSGGIAMANGDWKQAKRLASLVSWIEITSRRWGKAVVYGNTVGMKAFR